MKDAKAEAQKEIEDYRKQKEEEFKKFEAEVGPDFSIYPIYVPAALVVPDSGISWAFPLIHLK